MTEPEPENDVRPLERASLSREDKRRIDRASFLKPLNLIVLATGAGAFAVTGSFWFVPLTLVTYAVLVLLATRDPIFTSRVLGGRNGRPARVQAPDVSLERRARWLPRGETRRKVEGSLEVYRKVIAAIEWSDDVTRAVVDDAVPKLHAAADRLVEVAHKRERAASAIAEARRASNPGAQDTKTIQELEREVRNADAEISTAHDKLLELHTRAVRVSLETNPENRATATALNESLDEMNLRLEALGDTMSPPDDEQTSGPPNP